MDANVYREDEVKVQALIDNTAQGIFNYLKEIENKREVYEKRWIWELLQNALDSAPQDRKIDVKVIKHGDNLIFRHNGRPFKPEEVAHLIYHGSTKRQHDIGKFGTGFLVTHLLSMQVNVRGIREDKKKFQFILHRSGISPDAIKKFMEDTWKEYQSSLEDISNNSNYIAEYEYTLDNVSYGTAEEGIKALINIAPYVLVFNEKLGTIEISNNNHVLKFELINESTSSSHIIKIVKEEDGENEKRHEIWMAKEEEIDVAVKVRSSINGLIKIEILEDVPKIFIGFPLFGTQDLPYPVIVNSRKFEPTERRDGIFLGRDDTDYIKRNKTLLEKANMMFIKLISNSDLKGAENIYVLLNLGLPPIKDWLDKDWYINLIKNLISKVMSLKILKTENGDNIVLQGNFIPTVESLDMDQIQSLWDLFNRMSAYKNRMPAKSISTEWAKIIHKWESLGIELTTNEITIEKMTNEIETCSNCQNFKMKLDNGVDDLDLLNDFFKLLIATGKQILFDNRSILPNQNGTFVRKPSLLCDAGIDEDLKGISKQLGKDICNQLLNTKVIETVRNLLTKREEAEVLNEILPLIKNVKLNDNNYLKANMDLMKWILEHGNLESLEGYPLKTIKEDVFISVSKMAKEKPLAPKEIWDEKAREYFDLFPPELIISSSYNGLITDRDKWEAMKEASFILIDPLYKETEKLSQDDLQDLILANEKLDEEKDHEITEDLVVSKIAFMLEKDKGIMDTIRKSKEKTRKFLNFLFNYVIESDSQFGRPIEIDCKCGSKHKIYPTFWMIPLKNRQWVPVRKDKSEKPNAQYLALCLKDDENLLKLCRSVKPSKLLSILGISISDLMIQIVAKDENTKLELEKAMGSLYSTYMTNPNELSKIAQLAEIDPNLFITEIEARLQEREKIRMNQFIGALVEQLIKIALEKKDLKVERTGIGSDFAIENDFINDGQETVFGVRKDEKILYYIEVKSTNQEFVRMTLTQAKHARNEPNKHILCVVPLTNSDVNEEKIMINTKFVFDIGHKINDKVSKAESFQSQQQGISVSGDIEIELTEGPIRFKINKPIWESGKTLDQFLELIYQ